MASVIAPPFVLDRSLAWLPIGCRHTFF